MLISKSPEFERCSKKIGGDVIPLTKEQITARNQINIWENNDPPLQEALRWLYSQGWYFGVDNDETELNSLIKHIKNNGSYLDIVDFVEIPDYDGDSGGYLHLKTYDYPNALLLRHAPPQFHHLNPEGHWWPNDIIEDLLGIGGYDAINKRRI